MPFAGDLPNNNFAVYEAEMVMWKCKWQNVTEKPSTLIDTLEHATLSGVREASFEGMRY
jgi:hypothetical protein